MSNQLGLTEKEKKVIMTNFFPVSATSADMSFCMGVANQFGLNPLLNQIYFVERKSKVNNQWITKTVPMVGRGGFLTIAHKSGKFAGLETSAQIEEVPQYGANGWEMKSDLVATAKVYRTDTEKPFIVSVAFSEYAQYKEYNGVKELTKFWKEKGVTMLKKVAESQAYRTAFNVSGIYVEEEINDNNTTDEPKAKELPKEHDDVNAMLTEDLGSKSVNVADGTSTEEVAEEMPAYATVEDTFIGEKQVSEQIHKNQSAMELDIG